MYNNGNSSKNVTGASVVDGTLENADYADDGISGDKIDGGIISNFQSTGIDDRGTTGKILTLSTTGADVDGDITADSFTGNLHGATTTTCKNVSGGTLFKGTPVYQSGTAGNAMEVQAADASSAVTMPAIGVLAANLADGAEGDVIHFGKISGVNTSAFSEGDSVYVAPGGGYTIVKPTGESNLIQNLGNVVKVHATDGGGIVTGPSRANATPNLDDGNVFIGNASNQAVSVDLSTVSLPLAGGTMTGTIAGFTSTGIDDNATSTAITIDASENVGIGAAPTDGNLEVITTNTISGTSTSVNSVRLGLLTTNRSCIMLDTANTTYTNRVWNITNNGIRGSLSIGRKGLDAVEFANNGDATLAGSIKFNGDTSAANALDDYETGTWTPAWTAGTSDATYVTQVGTYTKIGNKVHVQGRITISSIGTMSGALLMTGLPFTSSAATNNYSGLQVSQGSGLAITAGTSIGGYYPPSSTNIYVQLWDVTAGASGLTAAELSASGNIIFSVEYVTA